jgi:hypothetical protein
MREGRLQRLPRWVHNFRIPVCSNVARWRLMPDPSSFSQARAKSNQPTGKLGAQLRAQKQQTRSQTLGDASRDELLARDADANARERNYD